MAGKTKRPVARTCTEILPDGSKCDAWRWKDKLCYVHHPVSKEAVKEQLRIAQVEGAARSAEARSLRKRHRQMFPADKTIVGRIPDMSSKLAFRLYGADMLPLIADGTMKADKARVWVQAYQAVGRLFEEGEPNPLQKHEVAGVEPIEMPKDYDKEGAQARAQAQDLKGLETPDEVPDELILENIVRPSRDEDDPENT